MTQTKGTPQIKKPFRPEGQVNLDDQALKALADEGLDFRRDVEKRAAVMFVSPTSATSRSRQR